MPGIDCGSTFSPVCRLQSIQIVLEITEEYNPERWVLSYNTVCLKADVTEEANVIMSSAYKQFDDIRVPLVVRCLESLYGPHQSPTK